ncbi:MAG TPA: hypothetical protein VFQ51_05945, partial [Vicinamibacteria bacterium]|nr:hypothetical protein [Vicinamibacteria bacterium]
MPDLIFQARPPRRACRFRFALLAFALLPALAARADETEQIVGALGLRAGLSVADVGAGDGRFTTALARQVGPTGRV